MTFLMIAVPVLTAAAAGFLALRRPNIATGLFLASAFGALVLAATERPFGVAGLACVGAAGLLAWGSVLFNEPLYSRIFHRGPQIDSES